jgi:hypothetical protein
VRLLLARISWTIQQIRHGKADFYINSIGEFQKQKRLFALLLRKPLPFSDGDLEELVSRLYEFAQEGFEISIEKTLKACEVARAERPLSPGTQRSLKQIKNLLVRHGQGARMKIWAETIDQIVGTTESQTLDLQDFWAEAAQKLIGGLPVETQACWKKLLEYCRDSEQSKPSKKWLKGAAELVGQIGAASVKAAVLEWFPLVKPSAKADKMESYVPPMCERNVTVLKGPCGVAQNSQTIQLFMPWVTWQRFALRNFQTGERFRIKLEMRAYSCWRIFRPCKQSLRFHD